MTQRIYWRTLLLWTALAMAAFAAFNLLQWLVVPRSSWSVSRYAFGIAEHLPQMAATLLPFTAYAAGVVAAGRESNRSPVPMGTALLSGLGAGLLVLVLGGFVGPWVERMMTWDSQPAIQHFDSGQLDLFALAAEHARRVSEARASGATPYEALPWMEANQLGWQLNAIIAMSLMPVLTAPLGFLVGDATGRGSSLRRLVEAWTIGVLLFGVVSMVVVLGHEMTTQRNVTPVVTAWAPLFGPAVAVLVLWWSVRHAHLATD